MDKYRTTAEKKLKGQHPDIIAKEALNKAEFSSREREFFFNEAFGELMVEYYLQWLKTEPHETKAREFIYNSVLAMGDVKSRLISYETFGKNVPYMDTEDNDEGN